MPAVDDPRTLGRTRLSFADGKDLLRAAASGDAHAIHELGELGRPIVPSSGAEIPTIQEAVRVIAPNLRSNQEALEVVLNIPAQAKTFSSLEVRFRNKAISRARWRSIGERW